VTSNKYKAFDRHAYRALLRELEQALREQASDARFDELREQLADYDPLAVARWFVVGRPALRRQIDDYEEILSWVRSDKGELAHQRKLRKRSNELARRQVPQLRKDWAALFPKRRCAHCNRLFVAARRDAKTCSTRCRTALHRKSRSR
jgi:hypothetical protein